MTAQSKKLAAALRDAFGTTRLTPGIHVVLTPDECRLAAAALESYGDAPAVRDVPGYPKIGSSWRHYNGNPYTVLAIANAEGDDAAKRKNTRLRSCIREPTARFGHVCSPGGTTA